MVDSTDKELDKMLGTLRNKKVENLTPIKPPTLPKETMPKGRFVFDQKLVKLEGYITYFEFPEDNVFKWDYEVNTAYARVQYWKAELVQSRNSVLSVQVVEPLGPYMPGIPKIISFSNKLTEKIKKNTPYSLTVSASDIKIESRKIIFQ